MPFRSSVRNLGVLLDQKNNFNPTILDSECNCPTRFICHNIPHYYCNSVLAGLPLKQISRLQRVQNNAAKLVLRKSKYEHVTQLLQELHWLLIKFRPQYKIATFVHRFFDGFLPGYLFQTLCAYEPI